MTTNTDFDRHGHLNDFEAFRPLVLTTREIIDLTMRRNAPPEERTDRVVARLSTADLVRYKLNSRTQWDDAKALGVPNADFRDEPTLWDRVARFGVLDRETRQPLAMIWVVQDSRKHGFKITSFEGSSVVKVPADLVLEALAELDLPPDHGHGTAALIANAWDVWHEEGEWTSKEPQLFLAFTFSRSCYSVIPSMEEAVDVMVAIEADRPIDGGGDADAAYWNIDYYRQKSWENFEDGYRTLARPGFSSWGNYAAPKVVKVVGHGLDAEIERIVGKVPDAAAPEATRAP